MTGAAAARRAPPTSADAAALLRSYRIRAFVSTWSCYAGLYFCRKAFYVVKPELTAQVGLSASTLANVGVVYLVAYAIGEFNSAAVGSRVGARRLLLAGMAVSLGCNVAFGFANNAWTFMAFMALNGLAQATGWSGNVGTMAHWFRRRERGQVMGLWSTCYQIGGALANGFAGWRWSFWGASLVLGGVWLLFYALQRNRPEDVGLSPLDDDEPNESAPSASSAAGAKPDDPAELGAPASPAAAPSSIAQPQGFSRQLIVTVMMMGTFYFFVKFIRYALWSWAPYFLKLNFGLASDDAGYFSTLFDVFGFLGVITAGFVSDRVFKGKRTTIALLMMIGLTLSTLGLWVFGSEALFAFGIAYSAVGFMLYGPDSLLTGAGAIDVGSRKYAIAAAGIINGVGSLGSVVQELVVGRMYDKNPTSLGPILLSLVLSAVAATGLIAALALRARRGLCNL
jgi:OPA family glycerol-3-phosphate transporter-like MFS transporter